MSRPQGEKAEIREKRRTAGALHYTRSGLVILFFWLLWGDFCFTIMEKVMGSLLPLQLQSVGTSNKGIALMLSVLPNILGFTVGPWVSYKSDRCTHRWGRRKPFILWTMPFLCLFLAGIRRPQGRARRQQRAQNAQCSQHDEPSVRHPV